MSLQRTVSSELEYVQLCEDFVSAIVAAIMEKKVMDIPLIEFAMNIEEEVYKKIAEEHGLDSSSVIWRSTATIASYIALAEKVLL